ncbi:MAG: hypothetical protein ABJP02_17795 [Parasphingorhabdus sp.]|uniref:hypothetical protein n=1 Tax=Parasphingorhabdus sp. TaxID=2709688 RepID=UPI0032993BC5
MKKSILAAAVMALMFPSPASAAALCAGSVAHVYIYASGSVHIIGSWRNTLTQICNVKEEWKGIDTQTCFAWFSAVSSANVENQQIAIYYGGLNQADCATIPHYGNAPAPVYIRLAE